MSKRKSIAESAASNEARYVKYTTCIAYLVDYKVRQKKCHTFGIDNPGQHVSYCELVDACLNDYSSFKINHVTSMTCQSQWHWDSYWADEMAAWDEDTVVFIWYHGQAGGQGRYYWWLPSGFEGAGALQVWSWLQNLNRSPAAVMAVLDCFMQTRCTEGFSDLGGPFEIMSRPEMIPTLAGGVDADNDGNLTISIMRNMEAVIISDEGEEVEEGDVKKKHFKQPFSLAKLLAGDKFLYSNPQQWRKGQTKARAEQRIVRLKLDSGAIMNKKKFEFVGQVLQGFKLDEEVELEKSKDMAAVAKSNGNTEKPLFIGPNEDNGAEDEAICMD